MLPLNQIYGSTSASSSVGMLLPDDIKLLLGPDEADELAISPVHAGTGCGSAYGLDNPQGIDSNGVNGLVIGCACARSRMDFATR